MTQMALKLINHQELAVFLAKFDKTGGITDELVCLRGTKTPLLWPK